MDDTQISTKRLRRFLDFEIQRQTVTKLYLTQDNYLDCQQTWEFDVVLPPEVSGWFQRNSYVIKQEALL